MLDGDPDVVQRDAGVQQAFDDLEDQDVLERVQPLTAGSGGAADGGHHQRRAGPVVQLPVGDAGDLAGARPAVADEFVGHRVVREEAPLDGLAHRCGGRIGRLLAGGQIQLLLTWRLAHYGILSPIDPASGETALTCTAVHLPRVRMCPSIRFPTACDCSSPPKYGGLPRRNRAAAPRVDAGVAS
jgi:hypothetical protein